MKPILFAIILLAALPMSAFADIKLPVENGVVTSGVGWRVDPFGSGKLSFHRGIDIAVPAGTPVRAIRKGRVVFAGKNRGYGFAVIIEHANGDRSLYGHNSLVKVSHGESVEAGSVVAFSGNSGRSTGPHVHFEKIPSGRTAMESEEIEVSTLSGLGNTNDQRYLLEQKMEDSVESVLRTIKGNQPSGPGG